MLDKLDRGLNALERLLYLGAAIAMALMMVSITSDALGRYFFDAPIKGVYEVNEMYLLTATVYLSIARAQRMNEHISVQTVYQVMPGWGQKTTRLTWRPAAAVVFAAIAYKTGDMALDQFMRGNRTSGVVELPSWIGWFLVSLGSTVMCLRLVLQVVFDLCGRDPDAGMRYAPAGEE